MARSDQVYVLEQHIKDEGYGEKGKGNEALKGQVAFKKAMSNEEANKFLNSFKDICSFPIIEL